MTHKVSQKLTREEEFSSWHGGYAVVVMPNDPIEACMAVPAVKALKKMRMKGSLTVVCSEETAPIWEFVAEVDHIISLPEDIGVKSVMSRLETTHEPYDSALIFEAGPAASAISQLKIPQRVGYQNKQLSSYLVNSFSEPSLKTASYHRTKYYCDLVRKIGGTPYLKENFAPNRSFDSKLRNIFLVSVESSYGSAGEWSIDSFKKLLEPAIGHIQIQLISLTGMNARIRTLGEELGDEVEITVTKNLSTVFEILENTRLVLACDGLLPHLANHVGVSSAAIYGPGCYVERSPLGSSHKIITSHAECSPCFAKKCPLDSRCMKEIDSVQVGGSLGCLWKQTAPA